MSRIQLGREQCRDKAYACWLGKDTGGTLDAVLGPQEARGFPATENVPKCPKCQGMKGFCHCEVQGSDS